MDMFCVDHGGFFPGISSSGQLAEEGSKLIRNAIVAIPLIIV